MVSPLCFGRLAQMVRSTRLIIGRARFESEIGHHDNAEVFSEMANPLILESSKPKKPSFRLLAPNRFIFASVVESADMRDLGSRGEIRYGFESRHWHQNNPTRSGST